MAEPCWVFIDNSNLVIEGRKYFAEKQRLIVKEDNRMRVDMGNLTHYLIGKRRPSQPLAWFYGSEPPPVDTVWREIAKKNIQVKIFKKNVKGKEKGVDTALAYDIASIAQENKGKNGTFIIISGDSDYLYPVQSLLEKKFKVEVVSWKKSLSPGFRELSKKVTNFTFRSLGDEIAKSDNICYFNKRWKQYNRIPRDRTIAIEFIEAPRENSAETLVQKATEKFELPFLYHWRDDCTLFLIVSVQAQRTDEPQESTFSDSNDENNGGDGLHLSRRIARSGDQLYNFTESYHRHYKSLYECAGQICGALRSMSTVVEYFDRCQHANRDKDVTDVEHRNMYAVLAEPTQLIPGDVAKAPEGNGTCHAESTNQRDAIPNLDHAGYMIVEPRQKTKPQKYSTQCRFSFWCQRGLQCSSTILGRYSEFVLRGRIRNCCLQHSLDEKRFFDRISTARVRRFYKTKPCPWTSWGSECRFRNDTTQCKYGHGETDARCYICDTRGEHFPFDCPKKSEIQS